MNSNLSHRILTSLIVAVIDFFTVCLLVKVPAQAANCSETQVNYLVEQLQSKDEESQLAVVEAWDNTFFQGSQDETIICAFISVMDDANNSILIRRSAMNALGGIGTGAEQAIPHLISILESQNQPNDLRRGAILALRRIDARPASQALDKALGDPDFGVRIAASDALGSIRDKAIVAVPKLTDLLRSDPDSSVRSSAASSLGKISPHDSAVIEALVAALRDPSWFVRKDAATALADIGSEAKPAVPDLQKALLDKNRTLRAVAALTLGTIGEAAAPAVPDLLMVLQDENSFVRGNAAEALGKIGASDDQTIQALIVALNDPEAYVRDKAIHSLRELTSDLNLQLDSGQLSIDQAIDYLEKVLVRLKNPDLKFEAQDIQDVERYLNLLQVQRYKNQIFDRLLKNPWLWLILGYGAAHAAIFWFKPLWLSKIDKVLAPISIPLPFIDSKISAQWLIFGKHSARVLDTWVNLHLKAAQETFNQKETVFDRSVHIPLPITLNKHAIAELKSQDLRLCFKRHLLICGEGGSGKTSLACQIAKWAMSDDVEQRLSSYRMLPILLENELPPKTPENPFPLITAIKGQLEDLINSIEPISDEWLEQLLKKRRLLIIVDHLSEMSEFTRSQICPDLPEFIVNALVVTSRDENSIDGVNKTVIQPIRIEGNHVSSFMEAYLLQVGKRDLFTDSEFFAACSRLSEMVGQRNITPLLAKLYAEELISAKIDAAKEKSLKLPDNIPDLMLFYLNELNRDVHENKMSDRAVHQAAEAIAWTCLRENYLPTSAMRDDAITLLGGADAEQQLNYFENCLHLIQTVGPEENKIRFALDPLAEYLASLYLVNHLGSDAQSWENLLKEVKEKANIPSKIAGFFLALCDCCVIKGVENHVPSFVYDQLTQLKSNLLNA